MAHPTRDKTSKVAQTEKATYPAWKIEAFEELQRQHDIVATAIPERVWTSLYVRQLDPLAAAERAEIYYRTIRPAGMRWRKK